MDTKDYISVLATSILILFFTLVVILMWDKAVNMEVETPADVQNIQEKISKLDHTFKVRAVEVRSSNN